MKITITGVLCSLLILSLPASAETEQPINSPAISLMPQCAPPCASPCAPQCMAPRTPPRAAQPPQVSVDLKLQEQRLESFKALLDYQDKRISDLSISLSFSMAFFGALMTVVVVFFSFRSTREAVLAAKDEARKEAEKQSKEVVGAWIADEGQQLLIKKVEGTLTPEINKALVEIRAAADNVLGELAVELRNTHNNNIQQQQLIEELKGHKLESSKPLSQNQINVVEKVGRDLENIPPHKYQFNDWFTLAVGAYTSQKYEVAAEYFARAAEADTNPINQIIGQGHKAAMLSKLERFDEAIAVLEELVIRFKDSENSEVQEHVGMALSDIGFALLCMAKKVMKSGDEVGGNELLAQSLEKTRASLQFNSERPLAIGNLGYALFLLGKEEDARNYLAKAIALGGEEVRALELSDAAIYPLQKDEAFKALIKSL